MKFLSFYNCQLKLLMGLVSQTYSIILDYLLINLFILAGLCKTCCGLTIKDKMNFVK